MDIDPASGIVPAGQRLGVKTATAFEAVRPVSGTVEPCKVDVTGSVTYEEINLSLGYSIVTLDVAVGQYDSPPGDAVCTPSIPPSCDPSKSDYTFYSLTVEKNGFYGKYGAFEQDFEGSYFEAGYGATVSEIDLGISLIFPDKDITGDDGDQAIVFTIGKAFDL